MSSQDVVGMHEAQLPSLKMSDVHIVDGYVHLNGVPTALVIESEFVSVDKCVMGSKDTTGWIDARTISSGITSAFLRDLSAKLTSSAECNLPPVHYTDVEGSMVSFVIDDGCTFFESSTSVVTSPKIVPDDHVKVMYKLAVRTSRCQYTTRKRVVVMPLVMAIFCPQDMRSANRSVTAKIALQNGQTLDAVFADTAMTTEVDDDSMSIAPTRHDGDYELS